MARVLDNRFRVATAALVLFCFSLFLTSYSAKNRHVAAAGAAAVQELLYPFQWATAGVFHSLAGLWEGYFALVGTKKDNLQLMRRVEALESQNTHLREVASENERLRALLKMVDPGKYETVSARVIGYDASNWLQSISIDRGSLHGLREGMAVIGANGVVGQVIAAAPHGSKVLLLTDHASGIDAILQNGRSRGIIEGAGGEGCRWRFVSESEEVNIGDQVVTSGADRIYPKGLLVGVVVELEERGRSLLPSITVKPSQDLDRLESVLVVTSLPAGASAFEPSSSSGGEVR